MKRGLEVLFLAGLMSATLFAGCNDQSGDPTPPPPAQLECTHVMEWMRLRPATKRCDSSSDCVLQTDNCCDQTAVHKRYARVCERTCDQRCPQDTLIGHQVQWVPVCQDHTCTLKQLTLDSAPTASPKPPPGDALPAATPLSLPPPE